MSSTALTALCHPFNRTGLFCQPMLTETDHSSWQDQIRLSAVIYLVSNNYTLLDCNLQQAMEVSILHVLFASCVACLDILVLKPDMHNIGPDKGSDFNNVGCPDLELYI